MAKIHLVNADTDGPCGLILADSCGTALKCWDRHTQQWMYGVLLYNPDKEEVAAGHSYIVTVAEQFGWSAPDPMPNWDSTEANASTFSYERHGQTFQGNPDECSPFWTDASGNQRYYPPDTGSDYWTETDD